LLARIYNKLKESVGVFLTLCSNIGLLNLWIWFGAKNAIGPEEDHRQKKVTAIKAATHLNYWCRDQDLNQGHTDFQSCTPTLRNLINCGNILKTKEINFPDFISFSIQSLILDYISHTNPHTGRMSATGSLHGQNDLTPFKTIWQCRSVIFP